MSRKLARETAFRALFNLEFNHGEENEREIYEQLAIDEANAVPDPASEAGWRGIPR